MGNPFSSIKNELAARNAASVNGLNSNESSSYKAIYSNIAKEYAPIFETYNKMKSKDIVASIEQEIVDTQKSLQKQQTTQAIIGTLTASVSQIPSVLNLVDSLKSARGISSDSNKSVAELNEMVTKFNTEIFNAKNESAELTPVISGLQKDITDAEATITEQKQVSLNEGKKADNAKDKAASLQASVDNESDETLVSLNAGIKTQEQNIKDAEKDLQTAKSMKTTKTVQETDSSGNVVTKTIQDPALVEAKNNAIKAATDKKANAEKEKQKLEAQKEERKALIAEDIKNQNEEYSRAVKAKGEAEGLIEDANKTIAEKKKIKNEKVSLQNTLNSRTNNLTSEVERINSLISQKQSEDAKNDKKK